MRALAEVKLLRLIGMSPAVLECDGCHETFDVDPESNLIEFIDQAKAFIRLHKPCPEPHGARRGA